MIPALGLDYSQRRLALPFGEPFLPVTNVIGVNVRKPLFKKKFELQPMPIEEVASTKGYFLGGLFPDREEVMERLRKQQEEARKPSRIATFMEENPDFTRSLASVFRDYR